MQRAALERSRADLIALVDDLIAAYVTWRTECSAVTRAYCAWNTGGRRHGDAVFDLYIATLDREERAATTYRSVLEQITTLEIELQDCAPRPSLAARPGSAEILPWSARSIAHRLGL